MGIEYDGSGFCGWQRQRSGRTVQGCLEQAVGTVANHELPVVCAGRTDTGVHATAQVIHFDTGAERTPRSWILGSNAQRVQAAHEHRLGPVVLVGDVPDDLLSLSIPTKIGPGEVVGCGVALKDMLSTRSLSSALFATTQSTPRMTSA